MHSTLARGLVFGLGISFLAACAGLPDLRPPPPDPVGRYVALTTPFVAMGDTQEHEATGLPMHDNDSAVDAYVEVAQRPPEQPLFGRKIFETVLASHPDEPLLHLGLPDEFIEHGDPAHLLALQGLDAEGITRAVRARFPL